MSQRPLKVSKGKRNGFVIATDVGVECLRFMYCLDLACLVVSCPVFIERHINGLLMASLSFWSGALRTRGGRAEQKSSEWELFPVRGVAGEGRGFPRAACAKCSRPRTCISREVTSEEKQRPPGPEAAAVCWDSARVSPSRSHSRCQGGRRLPPGGAAGPRSRRLWLS